MDDTTLLDWAVPLLVLLIDGTSTCIFSRQLLHRGLPKLLVFIHASAPLGEHSQPTLFFLTYANNRKRYMYTQIFTLFRALSALSHSICWSWWAALNQRMTLISRKALVFLKKSAQSAQLTSLTVPNLVLLRGDHRHENPSTIWASITWYPCICNRNLYDTPKKAAWVCRRRQTPGDNPTSLVNLGARIRGFRPVGWYACLLRHRRGWAYARADLAWPCISHSQYPNSSSYEYACWFPILTAIPINILVELFVFTIYCGYQHGWG